LLGVKGIGSIKDSSKRMYCLSMSMSMVMFEFEYVIFSVFVGHVFIISIKGIL